MHPLYGVCSSGGWRRALRDSPIDESCECSALQTGSSHTRTTRRGTWDAQVAGGPQDLAVSVHELFEGSGSVMGGGRGTTPGGRSCLKLAGGSARLWAGAPAEPSLGQLWVRGMLIGPIRVNERRHVEGGLTLTFQPWWSRRPSRPCVRPCAPRITMRAACCTLRASGWAPGLENKGGGDSAWLCVRTRGFDAMQGTAEWERGQMQMQMQCASGAGEGEPGQASRRQRGETGEDADSGQASRWRSLALAYCHGTLLRCRRPRPRSCALVNLAARSDRDAATAS